MQNPRYILIDIQAMSEEDIEKCVDLDVLRAAFFALKYGHDKDFFKRSMKKVLKFVDELPTEYLFQEFYSMLMEYAERRSGLEEDEFKDIVNQNSGEMATKYSKTSYELAEERGEIRGEARGLRKAAIGLMQTTAFTNAQIAKTLGLEEEAVKAIRQEITAVQ